MRVFNNLNKLTVLLCLIVVMCVLVLCASCICSKPVKRCTSESFVSKSNNNHVIRIPKDSMGKYKTKPFQLLNGHASNSRTVAMLSYNDVGLKVNFSSNPALHIIGKNPQLECNGDLWKQEVCEIFIRPKHYDPEKYLEIEINPFGYLWVTMDTNKGCKRQHGVPVKKIDCKDSNIQYFSTLDASQNLWLSQIVLPWDLLKTQFHISGDARPSQNSQMRNWMINMFCVRMKKNVEMCTNNSECEFTAWSPTGKYEKPDFHQCSAFREIELVE